MRSLPLVAYYFLARDSPGKYCLDVNVQALRSGISRRVISSARRFSYYETATRNDGGDDDGLSRSRVTRTRRGRFAASLSARLPDDGHFCRRSHVSLCGSLILLVNLKGGEIARGRSPRPCLLCQHGGLRLSVAPAPRASSRVQWIFFLSLPISLPTSLSIVFSLTLSLSPRASSRFRVRE